MGRTKLDRSPVCLTMRNELLKRLRDEKPPGLAFSYWVEELILEGLRGLNRRKVGELGELGELELRIRQLEDEVRELRQGGGILNAENC